MEPNTTSLSLLTRSRSSLFDSSSSSLALTQSHSTMSSMAVLIHGFSSPRPSLPFTGSFNRQQYLSHSTSFNVRPRVFTHVLVPHSRKPSTFLMRSFQDDNVENSEAEQDGDIDDLIVTQESKTNGGTRSLLVKLAIALGVAAVATVISVSLKRPVLGSASDVSTVGFTFKAFGYSVVLPAYAPGWIYFWLLMAAACGLFISEEALNIWVGISLARLLSLDGTWQSFAESFSRNAPYIISTVLWVYWGVCISDMIPFYLGKLFRQTKASDDVCSKLGIDRERALSITRAVQRYGNLIGFVERFSLGVRNPTAFVAGALGISPERFFAGVCFGGLITLPLQLAIGFLLRERPVFAVATVATAVGIWTVFPYGVAASTALFLYLRRRYST